MATERQAKPGEEPPRDSLVMYTIYEHPRDYPEWYVLRRCWTLPGEIVMDSECRLGLCPASLRNYIPKGLVRCLAGPDDDPVIVEVWL